MCHRETLHADSTPSEVTTSVAVSGTTVVRRQLGRRLTRLRERVDITHARVTETLGISRASMYRLESGQVEVKTPILLALLDLYGVKDEGERAALLSLAAGTRGRGWWQEYGDDAVPEWLRLFVDLESVASEICTWEDSVVPGELQTADYARAVFAAAHAGNSVSAVERQIAVRLARQERLFGRRPPPRLSIILGECVLVRQVGGKEVMAAQVAHLRRLAQEDHIEIRVLPFASGAHAAMTGAFRVLDFEEAEDPDVVYVEAQRYGRYLERDSELAEYRAIWGKIYAQSVPIGEHQ